DVNYRALHANAIAAATDIFENQLQRQLFLHYGTLLGYGRSRAFLAHDDDVDLSFLVISDSLADAVAEFYLVVDRLIELEFPVYLEETGQFNFVPCHDNSLPKVDVFLSWFSPK